MAIEQAITIRLAVDLATHAGREMAQGIIQYARAHTLWQLITDDSPADGSLMQTDAPLTGVTARMERSGKSFIVAADAATAGKMAAEHLAERGFKNFAGAALPAMLEKALRAALPDDATYHALPIVGGLVAYANLIKLPQPLAMVCGDDPLALSTARAVIDAGVRVPEAIAILGIGNDAIACELAATPVSSIDLNFPLIGFRAAQQLDRLLRRRSAADAATVAPLGVIVRASTDVLAIADEDIAAAVRFLRANAHRSIDVADLLRDIPLHRRTLERRFRKHVGRSPAEELRRSRVRLAQHLLARTDQPMAEIAPRAGFLLPQHLAAAFRQVTGMTPTAYREQFKRK